MNQAFLDAYFKDKEVHLRKLEKLRNSNEYLDIVLLSLCCYIDELASLRFTNSRKDNFKNLITNYCFRKEFNLIDLYYFYQWEKNDHIQQYTKTYWDSLMQGKKIYLYVKTILLNNFNEESVATTSARYQELDVLTNLLAADANVNFAQEDIIQYLQFFSNIDFLFYFGRCISVHQGQSLFLNEHRAMNYLRIDENHLITTELVIQAIKEILANMKNECEKENKWPWELR
jgi:hypothetical protein